MLVLDDPCSAMWLPLNDMMILRSGQNFMKLDWEEIVVDAFVVSYQILNIHMRVVSVGVVDELPLHFAVFRHALHREHRLMVDTLHELCLSPHQSNRKAAVIIHHPGPQLATVCGVKSLSVGKVRLRSTWPIIIGRREISLSRTNLSESRQGLSKI